MTLGPHGAQAVGMSIDVDAGTATGGALLVAGGVLGALALNHADPSAHRLSDFNCRDRVCPESRKSDVESEIAAPKVMGTVSVVLAAAGVAAIAVGVTLWLDDSV